MSFLTALVHSRILRKIIYVSLGFIAFICIANIIFDKYWSTDCMTPVTDLNEIYKTPDEYNNSPKINLKLSVNGLLCIEGNQKFRISDNKSEYTFIDSLNVIKPDTSLNFINKIYLNFQHFENIDSIYYVVSKSQNESIFYNQIFYSSVKIQYLNKFSQNPANFRLDTAKLVRRDLLIDNDTLIQQVLSTFNNNISSYNLTDCGVASKIIKTICGKYNLPCNIITLQGGNLYEGGYNKMIGYPQHVVCEIYSSKKRKWFVLDPFYGAVLRLGNTPLNAAEILNTVYFNRENNILQDSVLLTYRSKLNGDYFRVYQNIYYTSGYKTSFFIRQLDKYFYGKYKYAYLHYTNNLPNIRNGNLYIKSKSIMYFIIVFIYLSSVFTILLPKIYALRNKNIKQPLISENNDRANILNKQ